MYKKIKRIRFYGIETIDKKNNRLNEYYANENGIKYPTEGKTERDTSFTNVSTKNKNH